jgi:hypothetical protein
MRRVVEGLLSQDLLPQAKNPNLHPAFKPSSEKEITLDTSILEHTILIGVGLTNK